MSETGNAADGGSDLVTVSGAWLPDVGVRQCSLLDTTCQFGPTEPTLTDALGKASFVLEDNFLGYFELSKPDLVPGGSIQAICSPGTAMTTCRHSDSRRRSSLTWRRPRRRSCSTTMRGSALRSSPSTTVRTTRLRRFSVAFTHLGPDSLPFYFRGGLPNPLATSTDNFGLAGAINVPSGTEMVTAWRTSDQSVIGSATFEVLPGTVRRCSSGCEPSSARVHKYKRRSGLPSPAARAKYGAHHAAQRNPRPGGHHRPRTRARRRSRQPERTPRPSARLRRDRAPCSSGTRLATTRLIPSG